MILVAKRDRLPDLKALGSLYLPTQTAATGQVPLSAVADIKTGKTPLVISHLAQFPAVTISFNLTENASLSTAVDEVNEAIRAVHLPPSITSSFQGAAQAFEDSLSSEVFLLIAALVAVYIVLGVLYESFIHPVTILSTLPSAGIGALLALMIAGKDLDVIGIIGIVLLIGIVKKNAIMIVDFALEAERKHGKSPEEAIFEASLLRLRPILMTTLAAMLGALPMLLGSGTGSELRRPLGLAIIGGLALSQVLTLFTSPVIYLAFDRLAQRFRAQAGPGSGRELDVSIPALFIDRPVATTLLALAIFLSGVLAYFHLPVAPLPNITFPVVVVQANMAGAAPEIMAATVAEPLEKRMATIAGVTQLTSTSYVGAARIIAQFDVSRDINGASRDVQAAIQAARADLPTTLRGNPTWRQYNPSDSPIMILALTSDTLTKAQLYDSADTVIQQQLSQVAGVGQITLGGGALPSVRIELEPDKLSGYGIGMEDVRAAVSAANADSAKGDIDQGDQRFEVTSNDQATVAADYRDLVIAYRNGAPVLLRDVAQVNDANENIRNVGLYNDKPAVGVIVYPIPGANIVATDAQIRKVLPSVEATLPHGAHVNIAMDRSQSVNAAVGDTERTLTIAVILVIAVVFVFLQSVRSIWIPAVALPLSIIGTFGPMYLLGYSIDNLSLMALTIGTGFVVDDAVVVLENIVRHLDSGLSPREAALRGSAEVGFTVISMSLSLIAVFIPILLMPGTVGLVFHEFAVTLSIAILFSMVISLTITPCMCAHVLKQRADLHSRARWAVWMESQFDRFRNAYARGLHVVLDRTLLVGLVLIGLIVGNVYLFKLLPSTFFPEQDTGIVIGQIIADQAISFPAMSEKLAQLQRIVQKDPGVASVFGFAGSGSAGRAGNTANIYIELKPLAERGVSAARIVQRLRPKLNGISGARLFLQAQQDLHIGGRQSAAEYQYTLSGDDAECDIQSRSQD